MPDRKRREVAAVDERPIARAVGARIRSARLEAGLSQRQLAGARYTPAYISALETGRAKPSIASLFYVAGRLGREPCEFLGGISAGQRSLGAMHAASVHFADKRLYITFRDHTELGVPLSWFPQLRAAPWDVLEEWQISDDGQRIAWLGLDALVDVRALLGADSAASVGGSPFLTRARARRQ